MMAIHRRKKTNISLSESWRLYTKLQDVLSRFSVCDNLPEIVYKNSYRIIGQALTFVPSNKKTSSRRTEEHASDVENIAYRFVGYPTPEQEHLLLQNIGGSRWLWNRMKADRDAAYEKSGKTVVHTPAYYKKLEGCEWLARLDSFALCNVQLAHERAYNEYLSGEKSKPHYKKKHVCRDTYTTNKNKKSDNISLKGGWLKLPKIPGMLKLRTHRDIPDDLIIKSCTVCHEPDGRWMFSILCERPVQAFFMPDHLSRFLETGDVSLIRHIGLDMSLPNLYVDSNGCLPSYINQDVCIRFSKAYRKLERRIAKEQRRLSNMVKDSNNYTRQCKKIARLHAKAKQQRSDFLHQVAVRLARDYDIISIEDLNMSAMKKALKFGKSISDNGWGTFISILEQKCEQYGTLLVKVNRWFPSSKTCSHCGHVHKELKLSDRLYVCPECGHTMNRDHQAACNIDEEGIRILREELCVAA